MSSDHAPLPPSSAHMWIACHGWRRLNAAAVPLDDDETASEEGTAAHWVALCEISGDRRPAVGDLAPNGVAVTDDMIDGAALYADAIGSERSSLLAEARVDVPYVHEDNWGTPDAWRLFDNIVDVWDYKFGHRYVDAFENWQLIDYAAGIVGALKLPPDSDILVRMTIVQPRCYVAQPVRSWTITVGELIEYADRLRDAARAADDPAAECSTGPYCRDCKARHECPAHLRSGGAAIELSGASTPVNITPAALGRELALIRSAMDRLKSIESGLTAHGMALARDGARIPGFALKQGAGRTRWTQGVAEVIALGAMMGIDIAKPGALTPNQAIKAGLDVTLVEAYSETPKGAVTLEADGSKFERIFAGGATK